MPLPDVIVRTFTAVTSTTRPTNTGVFFYVAQTPRGWAKKPRLCRSVADVVSFFGERVVTTYVYDVADTFFNEGGTELWISRAYHSDAVAGKLVLKDSGTKPVLNVEAGSLGEPEPGAWSGSGGVKLKVEVVSTTGPPETFVLKVFLGTTLVEESPALESINAAIGWANQQSAYVVLTAGAEANATGAKLPTTLATSELTGTAASDGSAVVDGDYKSGLERITKDYGPGQVGLEAGNAGTTTRQVYGLEHAAANNRFALLDGADTSSTSTLKTQATSLYAVTSVVNGITIKARRLGQLVGPWDVAPGLVPYTTRTVPPCARLAAEYALIDAAGNPNRSAMGARGQAKYVTDLSQPAWTDAQRAELNAAGITVSRRRFGSSIQTYGLRTLADQVNDPEWSEAPNVRTVMAITAQIEKAMDPLEGDQIDGFGSLSGAAEGRVNDICASYLKKGALYGKTPQEAYAVTAGEALNSAQKLREGYFTVEAALKVSPAAEQIGVRIVKVPITQLV